MRSVATFSSIFLDDECHKTIINTLMLVQAGIMKEDGTVLKREIKGGVIEIGADGTPTGFLSEQAQTYVRQFMDHESLYSVDMALSNLVDIEHRMLSEGYTMYHEGWGNYFLNNNYYKALQQLDRAGKLNFVVGLPYEIESWMDMDEALGRAVEARRSQEIRLRAGDSQMDKTPSGRHSGKRNRADRPALSRRASGHRQLG